MPRKYRPAIRPSPTDAADRCRSRAARAASKGRAASSHSATKRPRAPASGVLKAAALETMRRRRATTARASVGRAAPRPACGARARNPADDHAGVHAQVPQHEAEQREREHVDAASPVECGQRNPGGEAHREEQGADPPDPPRRASDGVDDGEAGRQPGSQEPRARRKQVRRAGRAGGRPGGPCGGRGRLASLPDGVPRGGRAIGGGEQRPLAVGFLHGLDEQDGRERAFPHARQTRTASARAAPAALAAAGPAARGTAGPSGSRHRVDRHGLAPGLELRGRRAPRRGCASPSPPRVFSSIRIGWPTTLVCASRWAARFTVSPTQV